jgi:hypothetical protein
MNLKILQALHDFEFTASGGIAIYFLMCAAYVTIVGLYQFISSMINWIIK